VSQREIARLTTARTSQGLRNAVVLGALPPGNHGVKSCSQPCKFEERISAIGFRRRKPAYSRALSSTLDGGQCGEHGCARVEWLKNTTQGLDRRRTSRSSVVRRSLSIRALEGRGTEARLSAHLAVVTAPRPAVENPPQRALCNVAHGTASTGYKLGLMGRRYSEGWPPGREMLTPLSRTARHPREAQSSPHQPRFARDPRSDAGTIVSEISDRQGTTGIVDRRRGPSEESSWPFAAEARPQGFALALACCRVLVDSSVVDGYGAVDCSWRPARTRRLRAHPCDSQGGPVR